MIRKNRQKTIDKQVNKYKILTGQTLYLLVTCSIDSARARLAEETISNLVKQLTEIGEPLENLVCFDNNSKIKQSLINIPPQSTLLKSSKNIGFWAALYWVVNNIEPILRRKFDYIYIIESDLIHFDMYRIFHCIEFLNCNRNIHTVRTQEINLRKKILFNKKFRWLPFHNHRSQISFTNPITGKKAIFERVSKHLYRSTLHPKVPALHRFNSFKSVLNILEKQQTLTEEDFMREMMDFSDQIGILDLGIYYSNFCWSDSDKVINGSYSKQSELKQNGYMATRVSSIDIPVDLQIAIDNAKSYPKLDNLDI